jgi:hypothetical protein
MSLLTLMTEIGEDADLLTRTDEWLECERQARAKELDRNANELRLIILAQRIKTILAQKNLVPLQEVKRDNDGNIVDITIRIVNLPDAFSLIAAPANDTIDKVNALAQLYGWESDGYDIETSAALRQKRP